MVRDLAWNLGPTLHPARDPMMRNAMIANVLDVTARLSTRDAQSEVVN